MALKKEDIKIGDVVVRSDGQFGNIVEINGNYFAYWIPTKDIIVCTSLNSVNNHPELYRQIGGHIFNDSTRID